MCVFGNKGLGSTTKIFGHKVFIQPDKYMNQYDCYKRNGGILSYMFIKNRVEVI